MFDQAKVFNQDLSLRDASSVTSMVSMFSQEVCFNQNLTAILEWMHMIYMFTQAESFDQDLSSWDVSSITCHQYDIDVFSSDDLQPESVNLGRFVCHQHGQHVVILRDII